MALETGTYTNDLVVSNPVASDGLGQTDDHLRLIKSALKNTFASFTSGPLSSSQAQLDAAVAAVAGTGTSLRFPLGTVALPGVTPVGDTDTGVYSPAANQLALATGGVVGLSIDAAQNTTVKTLTTLGGVSSGGALAGTAVVSSGAYSGGTGQLVSIGSASIWFEDTLPAEGGYCWANGGTLSRSGNPLLWARWGTKYGAGDGTTTFNVPNLCEVVPVGQRAMGGASSRAILATGVLGGAAFGEAAHALTAVENAPHQHGVFLKDPGHNHSYVTATNTGLSGPISLADRYPEQTRTTGNSFTGLTIGSVNGVANDNLTASQGSGTAHNNVQPSTAVNFIIRIG